MHALVDEHLSGVSARDSLTQRLTELAARGSSAALLLVGLDNIRGDTLLSNVGDRIDRLLASRAAMVTRAGGDAFAVLLADVDADEAVVVAQQILELVGEQAPAAKEPAVTACVGIAPMTPSDGPQPGPQALLQADQAMYHARLAGPGRIAVYAPPVRRNAG
jgi:diguanylate cyclase (GGDEF)-like protein